MNSWLPIVLVALLGTQTTLIIGCYIYVSRQAQSLHQQMDTLLNEHKKADSETHALLFELVRKVSQNHAHTKGKINSWRMWDRKGQHITPKEGG